MIKFNPILMENNSMIIHPLRQIDAIDSLRIENDLFEILNDKETTEFLPEHRISDKSKMNMFLFGAILGYERQTNYMHFLTAKKINQTIGVINLITPSEVEKNYQQKGVWYLEYYLNKKFWNQQIMSNALFAILENIKQQEIHRIGALTFIENIASVKILEKLGFNKIDLTTRGLTPKSKHHIYNQIYLEKDL